MFVLNKNKGQTEEAKKVVCPRCRGAGSVVTDRGAHCSTCNGYGKLWKSNTSGWHRTIFTHFSTSFLI